MAFIEEAGLLPRAVTPAIGGSAGKTIHLAADQVPQGVTGKQVQSQQDDVDQQHQRANTNAKVQLLIGTREPERADRVIPEEAQEYDGAVKEIAMEILQDEGKTRLAAIVAVCRFAHGTARRVQEERSVIRFAVVITSHAEPER